MRKLVIVLFSVAGIIHLLPLSGLLGVGQLNQLYGLSIENPNLAILMQHRAILFGLLGALLIVAGFRPALQNLALVAGLVSVNSFFAIAWFHGGFNDAIETIVKADVVALVCLLAILALRYWASKTSSDDVNRA